MKVISGKAIVFTLIACSSYSSLHARFLVPKHEIGVSAGTFELSLMAEASYRFTFTDYIDCPIIRN